METNYQSFAPPDPLESIPSSISHSGCSEPTTSTAQHSYRGFSTSIAAIFQDEEYAATDCCSLTCCGLIQSDRDRFLVTGVRPPTPCKRISVHFVLPLVLFFTAGLLAVHIPEHTFNEIACTAVVLMIVAYFMVQCYKGSLKRRFVRKQLLRTKYEMMHEGHSSASSQHTQDTEDENSDHGYKPEHHLGQRKSDLRCAHPCWMIGCYAQDQAHDDDEETDLKRPQTLCSWLYYWCFPSPLAGYHVQVCGSCAMAQEARELARILPPADRQIDYITMQPYRDYASGNKLSQLSWQLITWACIFVFVLILWCMIGPWYMKHVVIDNRASRHVFGWIDLGIFFLTWGEAIGLLFVFAKFLSKPEPSQLSVDAMIKFFAAGFCLSTFLAVVWQVFLGLLVQTIIVLAMAVAGVEAVDSPGTNGSSFLKNAFAQNPWTLMSASDFIDSVQHDHPIFALFYIFFATFILAAMVEELCKYYGYRMCEHPDLLFNQNDKSKQARGAAITMAMLSTAMGFTCCENLVYVFVYGGTSTQLEFSILFARSLFPVHPLAAALQSLGVVERDVEAPATTQTKSKRFWDFVILGPAILFHGFYDFLIVWLDYLGSGNWTRLESVGSFLVLSASLAYYIKMRRKQQQRLQRLDRAMNATSTTNVV
ncbi:hypothetical protein FisN_7Lh052 [Fistulifera solaris]|uniref:Uncharacterized protein n=1 Tax=Fistulifera solaris TaxID=1519565 RepID=A0A1Z5JCF8_FISSO|nr:hypothetical protein FisN_7Lh052 [Fistulifera solaris]|eukprot:GAX11684.1 hypothetical protein FisN_7Lh052 [Fistulifera solaris]